MAIRTDVPARGFNPNFGAVRTFIGAISEGFAAHRRYVVLSALTDAELAARGLTRTDVPRVAFFGR
jgi:hypothetical protein